MEDKTEFIDILIKESLTGSDTDSCPSELTGKVMKRISRYNIYRSIFFDFSIKSISLLLLFAISIVILLTNENYDNFWMSFLKNNITILIVSLGIVYFIFFLNEITEKFLSDKRVY
ncbi:MAG: hypothetical protein KAS71_18570 [Bacteroidales bacterium]|nr:hypothetical protein [Bacteroidales bacterium]